VYGALSVVALKLCISLSTDHTQEDERDNRLDSASDFLQVGRRTTTFSTGSKWAMNGVKDGGDW
jgi:hypothetical protein